MSPGTIVQTVLVFLLAGILEIAGGYLVWLWLRESRSLWLGVGGAIMLVLFGVALTWLPTHFGRAYAAYGGAFVAMSVLWGWQVDGITPDGIDLVGMVIVLTGMSVMMFWPRA
jgi:small multidrug resistance family-3 protein